MGRAPIRPPDALLVALSITALASLYFVAGKLGLSLALVNTSTTAVWPPTGIALAALLVLGRRVWPGVALGAVGVNLTTTGDLLSSVGIAGGNTIEAVVGAHLVGAFARGVRCFERPQDVLKFAFLAASCATVLSATIGTASLTLAGLADPADFGAIWWTWWLGDAAGALLVAPALVTWANDRSLGSLRARPLETFLLLIAVLLTGALLWSGRTVVSIDRVPLAFLSFPAVTWAAYRFGPREAATALVVLAAIADVGTLAGFGPFARGDQHASLLLLQAFLAVTAVTTQALAAAVLDRQRAQETIHATEQRLRLVAEDSARLRDDFLTIATHELRTPLTGFRGYVELAQRWLDRGDPKRAGELLRTALRQSDNLAGLIAQLLDASHAHADKLEIAPVPTDLSALVAAAVEVARVRSPRHAWVVDVAAGIGANVDPVRFDEVVTNLLDNAVKFTPGDGTIAVRLRAEGAEARLEVADQGIGIPPERLGRVFERFYRAHDDSALGGFGLGLYIASEIVKRHGGRIEAASEPGRGTTFTIAIARTDAPSADRREEPSRAHRARTGRVLVVDDDPDIRALVAQVLEDAGLAVSTAADGQEGLAQAARVRPDVVILDKLMPVMDGTAFAAAYRASGRAAPIIAFCAARDAKEWAESIGAVSYIGKPFDVMDLERAVLAELPATA